MAKCSFFHQIYNVSHHSHFYEISFHKIFLGAAKKDKNYMQ